MPLNLKFIEKYNHKPSKRTLFHIFIWGTLTTYMVYHLLQGNRGLFALFELKQIVAKEQKILSDLEHEQKSLYRRIKLLRPQSLDLDLLDERARDVLNVAAEDEIIVNFQDILDSQKKSS